MGIGFSGRRCLGARMFTGGMESNAKTFFVLLTMAIAVPTGIKIFNWLATMWGGKIEFKTPMLFCVGFLFQFLIAGLTGIMLCAAPFDCQLGNSYFVVAHFHYVIVCAILFTVFCQALGILVFVANLLWSYFEGRTAGSDPWDAWTLEWSIPSPQPAYNFSVIPTVKSRRPLWDLKHPADPDWKFE